jgi:hypothetical protein
MPRSASYRITPPNDRHITAETEARAGAPIVAVDTAPFAPGERAIFLPLN